MQEHIVRKSVFVAIIAMLFLSPVFSHSASAATPAWSIQGSVLQAKGGNVGLLGFGTNWTDYAMTFSTQIVANQVGWVVRGQSANKGYVLILDASNDSGGTPNALQEVVQTGANAYTRIATIALSRTLDSSHFSAGTPAYSAGTIGFREYGSEEGSFKDLQIVDANNTLLYQNALSQRSALSDFAVPGNVLPIILDGAKRDRDYGREI